MYFYILFAIFISRVIIIGASIADSFCFVAFAAYLLVDKYMKSRNLQKKYDEDFKNITEYLTKAEESNKHIMDDLRNSVDSLKIAVGFKKK